VIVDNLGKDPMGEMIVDVKSTIVQNGVQMYVESIASMISLLISCSQGCYCRREAERACYYQWSRGNCGGRPPFIEVRMKFLEHRNEILSRCT
jgi:hypothetical protein